MLLLFVIMEMQSRLGDTIHVNELKLHVILKYFGEFGKLSGLAYVLLHQQWYPPFTPGFI